MKTQSQYEGLFCVTTAKKECMLHCAVGLLLPDYGKPQVGSPSVQILKLKNWKFLLQSSEAIHGEGDFAAPELAKKKTIDSHSRC